MRASSSLENRLIFLATEDDDLDFWSCKLRNEILRDTLKNIFWAYLICEVVPLQMKRSFQRWHKQLFFIGVRKIRWGTFRSDLEWVNKQRSRSIYCNFWNSNVIYGTCGVRESSANIQWLLQTKMVENRVWAKSFRNACPSSLEDIFSLHSGNSGYCSESVPATWVIPREE